MLTWPTQASRAARSNRAASAIWRSNCQWPFRCCSTWRPAHTLTEHGSPLSRATPPSTPDSRSSLSSTTVVDTPPGAL